MKKKSNYVPQSSLYFLFNSTGNKFTCNFNRVKISICIMQLITDKFRIKEKK